MRPGGEIIYVAHPVGAATRAGVDANLRRAERWLRWLIDREPDYAFSIPWLPYCRVLSDLDPAHRERGIRDAIRMACACDGLVLVGGRISAGMSDEVAAVIEWGGYVSDLTWLGDEPPTDPTGYLGDVVRWGREAWGRHEEAWQRSREG